MSLVLILLLGAIIICSGWAFFIANPKWAFTLAILGCLLAGAILAYVSAIAPKRYAWALSRYYSLSVESSGAHVIRIKAIKGIPGIDVRAIPKGMRQEFQDFTPVQLPFSAESLWRAEWRLTTPILGAHFHDQQCRCVPKDSILEVNNEPRLADGTIDEIGLEYKVDDTTRPLLSSIDLKVGYPFGYGNDFALARIIDRCILALAYIAIAHSAGAFVFHIMKIRRRVSRSS